MFLKRCSLLSIYRVYAQVAKRHLSFNKPTIDYTTLSNDGDQICEGVEEEMDEDDRAKAPQQQNRHNNRTNTTTEPTQREQRHNNNDHRPILHRSTIGTCRCPSRRFPSRSARARSLTSRTRRRVCASSSPSYTRCLIYLRVFVFIMQTRSSELTLMPRNQSTMSM